MARVDDFDAFYHATRRPLLHQTYALTGDVESAAGSVEHAYAHAWSHWRKVRRLPDPAAWVRHEAWRVGGGVRARRLRRRSRSARRLVAEPADRAHAEHLQALDALPDAQRRAVVLHHLAELPLERIAREVGISEAAAESLLSRGEQAWPDGDTPLGTALHGLEDDIAGVRLTRAPTLRRSGERRHRQHSLLGIATAAALVAGGGLLIVNDTPTTIRQAATSRAAEVDDAAAAAAPATDPDAGTAALPEPAESPEPLLVDQSALLSADEIGRLTHPATDWSVTTTTDGTTGDPVYAPCQRQPFADPDGSQTLLRRFAADDSSTSAVQVIEESRNETQSTKAFSTMEDWYARCDDDGVQLLSTHSVSGLGDQARAFVLRQFGDRDTLLTVGIVRTGPVTSALVASTRGSHPVPVSRVLGRAGDSLTRVCLRVSGDCSSDPRVRAVPPLPALEHPGFVSAFDLPKITDVSAPWVGTDPAPSPDNPAATPCERAEFRPAQHPRTRVFVLPTAEQVPRRFGLSETVGTFPTRDAARSFVRRAYASARSCPKRELSASKPHVHELPDGYDGRVWRFDFEVAESNSVYYRVALVRSGARVALLSMSPSQAYDVDPLEFTRLAVRAGQRLGEAEPSGAS